MPRWFVGFGYASSKDIDLVVFISNNQAIFNSISRAMKEVNYPTWERPVGFGKMNLWLKNPESASIYLSRSVTSICEIVADVTSNTTSKSFAS